MPRRPKTVQQVVIPSTSLVASATRYPGKAQRIYVRRQDWQRECYRHFAICGEARFAARFFGHAVSRAQLGIGLLEDNTIKAQTSGPAYDLMRQLFSGDDGQVQMLDQIGVHLTIAGECYLVGRTDDQGNEIWQIISVLEMRVVGDVWTINFGDSAPPIELAEDDVVIRIWLPNPGKQIEADSPFRSLLPILAEIEWLTRHVFAQVQSRLAGAGILFLPQNMTFPPPPDQQEQGTNDATSFMLSLADAMLKPITDPDSPSSVIPIVVTAPDDAIDKAKLLTFWSELDAAAKELRGEAIRRFALGMDLPAEQVLGMGSNPGSGGGRSNGVSHWGAWQIEEQTIKLHVEPMLDVIVNALAVGYLRPALPGDKSIITYDLGSLRLRPDRSKEAFELYDRGLITAAKTREENGFTDDDAMDDQEFSRWLLTKMASGSAMPEQITAALLLLGIDLPMPAVDSVTESPAPKLPPVRSLMDHPSRPRTPAASALVAACDALVFRALERAGNRLRQAGSRPPGVPSFETHCYVSANGSAERALDDAWSCADRVLEGLGDPVKIVPVLHSYTTTLIAEQAPHTKTRLTEWLTLAGIE